MPRTVLVALLMLTLVGCSAINNMVELNAALDDGGYSSSRVRMESKNGHSVLYVTVLSTEGTDDAAEAANIAEIVWTNYPERYDELRVNINSTLAMTATEADLVDRFGEHPPGFIAEPVDRGPSTAVIIIVTLVAAALLAGLVFLVWWRGRRPDR
jgi:hypothetical protein